MAVNAITKTKNEKVYTKGNTEKFRLVKFACHVNAWYATDKIDEVIPLVKKFEETPLPERKREFVQVTIHNVVSDLYEHYSVKDKDGVAIGARKTGVTPTGLVGPENEFTALELALELIEMHFVAEFGRGRIVMQWLDGNREPHELTRRQILCHNWSLRIRIKAKDFGIKTVHHVGGDFDEFEDDLTLGSKAEHDEARENDVALVIMGEKPEKA